MTADLGPLTVWRTFFTVSLPFSLLFNCLFIFVYPNRCLLLRSCVLPWRGAHGTPFTVDLTHCPLTIGELVFKRLGYGSTSTQRNDHAVASTQS